MANVVLYDPVADSPKATGRLNPRVSDLNGKTMGLRVQWPRFEIFMDHFEELLRERYDIPEVIKIENGPRQPMRVGDEENLGKWEDFKSRSDTAILGLAA